MVVERERPPTASSPQSQRDVKTKRKIPLTKQMSSKSVNLEQKLGRGGISSPKYPSIARKVGHNGNISSNLPAALGKETATVSTACGRITSQDTEGAPVADAGNGERHQRTANLIGRRMEVPCMIQEISCQALWDTGAEVSLVNKAWLEKNLCTVGYEIRPVSELVDQVLVVEGVGSPIPYLGYTMLPFRLDSADESINVPFLVKDGKMKCPIVGTNAMREIMEGRDSREDRWEKLTQLGLEISKVTALADQLDIMIVDRPSITVRTVNKWQRLLPASH